MSLFARTAACGLYDLRAGSTVSRELEAYLAALTPLAERIAVLEAARDPARTPRPLLEARCEAAGFAVSREISDAALRDYARALPLARGHTLAELEAYLNGLGARLVLREQAGASRAAGASRPAVAAEGEALGGLVPDLETLRRVLGAALPAGAAFALDFGKLTWEAFDGLDLTAAELDEKDFTWAWFDLYGQLLPGKEAPDAQQQQHGKFGAEPMERLG